MINVHTSKRKPRLLRQVDVKLLEIMPKLQILLSKGDITFNYNYKRRRLSQAKHLESNKQLKINKDGHE